MKKSTGPLLIIGSSADAADLRYASGFIALDPAVFLHDGQRKYLVVPPMEVGRARMETAGVEILTPEALGLEAKRQGSLAGWCGGVLKKVGVRRVRVASRFPFGVARALENEGIKLEVADGPLYPRRAVKSEREIGLIAATQEAAVAAMDAAVRRIRAAKADRSGVLRHSSGPLTSEDVRAVIEETLLSRHCFAAETIVAGGQQAVDPHQRGSGPLRAGEAIVIDIFPQHRVHGYWGDITRTVVHGTPSAELRALYRAVKAAQAVALERIRPGVLLRNVHAAAVAEFERRGYETTMNGDVPSGFIHGTGHGVGLEIHEAPRLGRAGGRLRKGHVVTVEPGLYYPGIGGVRIEDTVAVTADGYRLLARYPKRFTV